LAAGWQPLNSNTDNPKQQAPKKTVGFIEQLLGVVHADKSKLLWKSILLLCQI
jgi:hypothetical protein